ncbi:MAG: tetratricopeptide repeat protein [Desulfosarcina sp.]|nr:tetratricopeptide repeat protein [Desulfosarcina sp.]MBC2742813.1 tetratricopeptide repeat protein [Desulfosarcina sp.]MBC2765723.1 tetratricopeptide repeat protein [Desulfosarcina sp.]
MSLMNDALRKRNRELAEGPVAPGFSEALRHPRLDRKWLFAVLIAVLFTASALLGIQLIQSGSAPSLLVKTPGPMASRPPGTMHNQPASTIKPHTPEENRQTPSDDLAETKQSTETAAAAPSPTASPAASTGSHPDIGKAPQSVSDASISITPPVNKNRPQKPIAQASNAFEPLIPKAENDTDPASRSVEPGPTQSAPTEKAGDPVSRRSRAPDPAEPAAPAPEPTKPVTAPNTAGNTTHAQLASQDGDLFFKKAVAYHRNNRLTDAIRLYKQVLQLNINHQGAMLNLAAAYMEQGAYTNARPLLERLNESNPRPKGVLLNLAITAIGTGSPTKALDYLDTAEETADASPYDIQFHRAVAYARMNRLQEALILYKKAEAERPDDPLLQFNLGVTCDALGLYPKALVHYEASVRATSSTSNTASEPVTDRIRTLRRYLGASMVPAAAPSPDKGQ